MKFKAIDHVTLYVQNVGRVKSYYESICGFDCKELMRDGEVCLQLETDSVHLFIIQSPDIDPQFVERQHVSFEVDDLNQIIQQLGALDQHFEVGEYKGFTRRNYRWCEWRDPEGIRLECVEHTE